MNRSEQKIITTTLLKGLSIVAVSLLTGLVGGALVGLRIANADHFSLVAVANDVSSLKQNTISREAYQVEIRSIDNNIKDIKKDISDINSFLRKTGFNQ